MTSPARAHRERVLASLAAGAAPLSGPLAHAAASASEYELMRARLGLDLRRLHEIQSVEGKIALKRELLPDYAGWVDGVLASMLAAGRGVQDEVFVTIMIWRIDVGDYRGALPLADAMLRYELTLPERYKRTPATLIAEEIADAALKSLGQGEDFELRLLQAVEMLVDGRDMHDQVRAKLEAAIGRQLVREIDRTDDAADGPAGGKRAAIAGAIARLERARALNATIGVKKELDGLKREAARLAAAVTETAGG